MAFKFSKQEMQKMEDLVKNFIETMGIKIVVPVDIFKLATDLGFDVRGAEFREPLDGILIVNEYVEKIDGFNSNKVIAYNCKTDIETKKFIVAHELAHYIWEKSNAQDKKIVTAARDPYGNYSTDEQEQRMDYIAASLLAPKDNLS